MQCPNPTSRYCLDLTKCAPWLRSKKVKRHKSDFCLTVNAQYETTFNECERTHTRNSKGTWITPDLVRALDRCRPLADLVCSKIEGGSGTQGKLDLACLSPDAPS